MDPHEGFILEYRGIRGCPGFRVESVVDAKPAFNFTTGVKQRTTRRRRKRRKHSQDDDDDDDDNDSDDGDSDDVEDEDNGFGCFFLKAMYHVACQ